MSPDPAYEPDAQPVPSVQSVPSVPVEQALDAGPASDQPVRVTPAAPGARVPLLTWIGLAFGGFVLGALGALVQANRRTIGEHTVWWGLVLVVVVLGLCVRAASYLVGTRRGGALVAVGWLVPTLVLAGSGPGGDVVLPSTARTTWYLGAAAVVALVALLWPLPRGTRELAAEHRSQQRVRGRDAEPLPPADDAV